MKYEKRNLLEENMWYVALYQVKLALDKNAIYYKNAKQIKELYNGEIPAKLYEKVFEGHVNANCFGSIYTFLHAHTPSFYKGRLLLPSSVIEIFKSKEKNVFYMYDGEEDVRVEFDKEKALDNAENELNSCVLSKNDVSFFYSSLYAMEQIKCAAIKVYKRISKTGESDYKLICEKNDGTKLNFVFCEFPPLMLTNFMDDFPEKALYVADKQTGYKVLDKDNMDLVCDWLKKHGYSYEKF